MKSEISKNEGESLSEKIFVTCNFVKKAECIKFFNVFKKEFNYLDNIELKFTPNEKYDSYDEDLQDINSGMPEFISLIDTRNLQGCKDEPIRLLLKDDFFKKDDREKNEHILHELGHFFTNPLLIKIRQYISENNPDKIVIHKSKYQQLAELHNKGLTYLCDIIKLPQEVNAELWVYKKEPKYSKTRLKRYCEGVNTKFTEKDKRKFFFKIPFINFHIIYRYSIVRNVDFVFKNACLLKIDNANKVFYKIANNLGWGELKQLKYQDAVLKSIECGRENFPKLIKLYEEIFEEYICISSSFFPEIYQNEILKFYTKNKI